MFLFAEEKIVLLFVVYTFILPRHVPTHIICSAELIRHQKVLFQIETFVSNYVRNDIQNCSKVPEQSMNVNIETEVEFNLKHLKRSQFLNVYYLMRQYTKDISLFEVWGGL